MQENANAVNVMNYANQNFGSENVSTTPSGVIKVYVNQMGGGDILTLSNMLRWADIKVKGSDTKMLIILVPKPFHTWGEDVAQDVEACFSSDFEPEVYTGAKG